MTGMNMSEELTVDELDINKRSAFAYAVQEGLFVDEDIPLSSRCNTVPNFLFVEILSTTQP